jgi:tetratricopeptide (TPR) repeat protein
MKPSVKRLGGILSMILACAALGQGPTELTTASAPLVEGVPEVAAARLQMLLNKNLSDQEWRQVAEKLAEALIASQRADDALILLSDARLRDSTVGKFWRAQALASLSRPGEALPLYEQVATAAKSGLQNEATFGAGEMLRALGRKDEALAKFAVLFRDQRWGARAQLRAVDLYLDKSDTANAGRLLAKMRPGDAMERKERHFLRGRLEMVSHLPEKAIKTFESLLKRPEGASHSVLTATLFAIADAHLEMKTPESGDDVLEDFVEHHPQDVDLGQIFAKLDELYRAERKPSRGELERWARDPVEPRRGFAQWYLARFDLRSARRDRAVEWFNLLRQNHPREPSLAAGLLEYADLELQDENYDKAAAILTEARGLKPKPVLLDRIDLLAAETEYRAGRFDQAARAFDKIVPSSSSVGAIAKFNASLGWLQLGDHARFLADAEEFAKESNDTEARAELRLEEGLMEAATGDKRAASTLGDFLRDFPGSKRSSEAWVALAELAFHATPMRLDEARADLARAAQSKPTAAAEEHADYLGIWIDDSGGTSDPKVIESCKRFLQRHPESALSPNVRMKLAELYYRQQDFPNAQTQFQILAEQNPKGPLAEKALFFAAKSATARMGAHSTDEAIVLFDQVVQRNGEMKWAARNEQAEIERKLGKSQDALALYEEVLKGDARPSEKREALCGKADIHFELGSVDPKNYALAIEGYEQLASEPNGSIHWRNQALFKKGLCLEKQANTTAALSTFYQILENESRPDRRREYFWFYKAGFNAGRLLEASEKWQSAAAVYQTLAAAGGTRSEEAKERLNRLRLEHFLWEE